MTLCTEINTSRGIAIIGNDKLPVLVSVMVIGAFTDVLNTGSYW